MPSSLIHDEDEGRGGEGRAEVGEVGGHHIGVNFGEFERELVAGARIDCGIEPEVLVAWLDDGSGMCPTTRPYSSEGGLEAEAAFVEEEEVVIGIGAGQFGEFFLKTACAAGSAFA